MSQRAGGHLNVLWASLRVVSIELEFRQRLDGCALAALTGLQSLSVTEALDLERSQVRAMRHGSAEMAVTVSCRPD